MIIDLILDRKDELTSTGKDTYSAHRFYFDCLSYNRCFEGIADKITKAMDYGTEQDVKKALCEYVVENGYNNSVCEFVDSVCWIN